MESLQEVNNTPSMPSEERGWARFSLSFLEATDSDTIFALLMLEGLTVRLTYNTGCSTRIVDVRVLKMSTPLPSDSGSGIEVVEVNADGEPLTRAGVMAPFLVAYEDIIDIGIY